jgi:hypothetical protein
MQWRFQEFSFGTITSGAFYDLSVAETEAKPYDKQSRERHYGHIY